MDPNFQHKLPKLQVPSSLKASRNVILEAVLLLVLGFLFYWFLLAPKLASVRDRQAQLAKAQNQRQGVEASVKDLQSLSQRLANSATDVGHLDQALPLSERQLRTQLLLNQLVKSSGVFVGDISINESGESIAAGNRALLKDPFGVKRVLGQLTVNLSVSGSFDQLLDLIKKLENYGRIMDISSLNISANNNGQLDMKLSLIMYYFGPAS